MDTNKTLVAYQRVSTKRQGDSGLGLEGQKAAVETYVKSTGSTIVKTFTEVESGKRSDRPELLKAIAFAKRASATLVVARLDRLSRNVAFLSTLMQSGVSFVACDYPNCGKLTIHLMVAVAENELESISIRTKAALCAAKKRGTLLGSNRPGHWDGREESRLIGSVKARKVSAQVRREKALDAYSDLVPLMREMRASGATLWAIAARLDADGQTTRTGRPWSATQVKRVLERAPVASMS
jgi:DNA invertase Pin-like site-specific DNA recombinase